MFKKTIGAVIATLVAGALILSASSSPSAAKATKTISASMKSSLIYLVQEEKLAYDVYTALAAETGIRQFSNISRSEARHIASVEKLLAKYGIANPIIDLAPGEFSDPVLQQLYYDLIESATDYASAIQVGVAIEELDISDLDEMLDKTMPTDVRRVLKNLLNGSYQHLAAFSR